MNAPLITELIGQHKKLTDWLEPAKEKEKKLREKIISLTFENPKKGTNKLSIAEAGLEVKALIKENITVDKAGLKEILETIPNGDKVIDWKPALVSKEYNALSDEDKRKLAVCITSKPGTPTLTYEGETKEPFNLSAKNGVLYLNGSECNYQQAYSWAAFMGIATPEDLIKELEGI